MEAFMKPIQRDPYVILSLTLRQRIKIGSTVHPRSASLRPDPLSDEAICRPGKGYWQ
jgi:hypothetical protein